ncbi:unnamed protein product [Prunus armeniaca]|uniref:Uncharacterized protein n=1 Tax=Prunus armeniaca TaxID=36596 RepID=A0A6J5UIZ2_PRUAR|nr:unnamed protein product [Prunus armeniaca]
MLLIKCHGLTGISTQQDFIPQIQNGRRFIWNYQKENQGAVVIVFTRTAPQAASVAAAKDFPARAAPSCALIGLPVTALVCSNGNQGQLVFCKQHGAAIKEKLQKSPRLAKEGSLSATDHHAVSETQHK